MQGAIARRKTKSGEISPVLDTSDGVGNKMNKVTPVILCGGSGTRLWPLSRKSFPKQFAKLIGDETLFQASARRMTGGAVAGLSFAAPLVLTASDFRFIVGEQLMEAGIDPGPILIEPEPRNTAPAILAAALFCHAGRS